MKFRWEKLGLVFSPSSIPSRPSWLNEFAQAPATLQLNDRLRIYFSCRPPADSDGRYVSYTAFVDVDADDPRRLLAVADTPVMPLGELGCFDEFGTYPMSVIRHEGRLLGYYGGWTRCESVPFNVAIGVAESHNDGRTFDRLGPGPVLSYTQDEPFVLSGPKIREFDGRLYLFYIAGTKWKMDKGRAEPVYRIRMAISDDGLTWDRQHRDLIDPRIEADEAQASPDVFYLANRYHMLFSYRASIDYRRGDGSYRIGYAWSDDLVNWNRDDDAAGITVSDNGWDSEMVAYPHVFSVGEELYVAYLGNEVGREGFGIARLIDREE